MVVVMVIMMTMGDYVNDIVLLVFALCLVACLVLVFFVLRVQRLGFRRQGLGLGLRSRVRV